MRPADARPAIQSRDDTTYSGTCFCGTVHVEAAGEAGMMGYCRSGSCRSWSAGPVNGFSLWKPEKVRVTAGQQHVTASQKSDFSLRDNCAKCGGHVMSRHPTLDVVDVFAATLPELAFKAAIHTHYESTVLPKKGGVAKMKDFPVEFGGSGETLAE